MTFGLVHWITSSLTKTSETSLQIFRLRMFCLLGSILYPAWYFVSLVSGNAEKDTLGGRIVVGSILFSAFVLSYIWEGFKKILDRIYIFLTVLITIHFFSIVNDNNLSSEYAVTSLIVVFALGNTFERHLDFFIFAVTTLMCSVYVTLGVSNFSKPLFLASIGTGLFLSYVIMSLQIKKNHLLLEKTRFAEGILETVPNILFIYSVKDQDIEYINKALEPMLGYSPEYVFSLGSNVLRKIIHPEDRAILKTLAQKVFHTSQLVEASFRVFHKDGSIHLVHVAAQPYQKTELGEIESIIGAAKDVTEEHIKAQQIELQRVSLIEAAKLASLGEMAGGLAHEINNPLTAILGSAHQLRMILERSGNENEKISVILNRLERTVERITKIVKSLRLYARDGSKDPPSRIKVSEVIQDALNLCYEKFQSCGVTIKLFPFQDDVVIDAQAVQIVQVLVNLLNNAFDAIEGKNEKWIHIKVQTTHACVKIFVSDSGGGVPESVRAKIMNPFFTTKPPGKGTGLGLSISKGIVESHGGILKLEDTTDHTEFSIELPRAA